MLAGAEKGALASGSTLDCHHPRAVNSPRTGSEKYKSLEGVAEAQGAELGRRKLLGAYDLRGETAQGRPAPAREPYD